ncbi:hypothetical protein SAMN02746093_01774 [Legionella quinlivanii DSM 21216]|nr:hypothetical protein SAMN02746093_01774 [Legionella quinlivanii DSM 21216]STY11521.1 Uncharacterised protein [Legionella quinlivanii]
MLTAQFLEQLISNYIKRPLGWKNDGFLLKKQAGLIRGILFCQ